MNTGRDLSAEARSAKVDRLDDAIDVVAARLTKVADDEDFAQRITSRLPERPGWSLWGLMPRVALGAIVLAYVLTTVLTNVRRSFDDRSTIGQSNDRPNASLNDRVNAPSNDRVNASSNVRRTSVERSSNDRANDRPNDFDGSLPALAAASALRLESLAPVTLTEDAPLTLLPLTIADLPLTAETISPREIEEQ